MFKLYSEEFVLLIALIAIAAIFAATDGYLNGQEQAMLDKVSHHASR